MATASSISVRFNGHIDVGVCSPVLNCRASVSAKTPSAWPKTQTHLLASTPRNLSCLAEGVEGGSRTKYTAVTAPWCARGAWAVPWSRADRRSPWSPRF